MCDLIQELILIVDNDIVNARLLSKRLQADGYQTLLSSDGEESLRLAQKELPSLIILDLMVSSLNGFEVALNLQNDPVTADIPYIFLTARSGIDILVHGLGMGAADYIIKPFHYKELLARIKNALKVSNQLCILKKENRKLHKLSILDDLTCLYNRRYFSQRLKEEVSRAERYNYYLTCLMIDIDYFKNINDQYGHLIGDIILKELAEIIRCSVRIVDVAARFGGEEFVVLLPQTNSQGGFLAAEKIRSKIEAHLFSCAKDISLTVSIGISCNEHGSIGGLMLLHQADMALYEAKQLGRNKTQIYRSSTTPP